MRFVLNYMLPKTKFSLHAPSSTTPSTFTTGQKDSKLASTIIRKPNISHMYTLPRLNPTSYRNIIAPLSIKINRHKQLSERRLHHSAIGRQYNHNLTLTKNVDCDFEESREILELFHEYHHFLGITSSQ